MDEKKIRQIYGKFADRVIATSRNQGQKPEKWCKQCGAAPNYITLTTDTTKGHFIPVNPGTKALPLHTMN